MNVETPYEQLLFTTALIQADYPDGKVSSGTGFFYGVNVAADQLMMLLVTNKHVIDGAANVRITLIGSADAEMKQPNLGKAETITIPTAVFVGHPDPDIDVAVAPIGPWMNALQSQGKYVFLRSLAPAIALTDDVAATLDALEDVTFIGYPNGLYDKLNRLPIARRGITATPVAIDYEGKPIFLVDASVFPGSSGSPVFIAQTGGYAARGGGFVIGSRMIFLGIIAAVYQRSVPVLQIPTQMASVVKDPLNIGIVYKAKTIEETVDQALKRYQLKRYSAQSESVVITPTVGTDPVSDKVTIADS